MNTANHKGLSLLKLAGAIVTIFMMTTLYAHDQKASDHSKLEKISALLHAGMLREKVEKLVAETLAIENNYSPYGNNLGGGIVEYKDRQWILEITYNPGAPAPWVINKQGIAEHYLPIDETVKSYRLYKLKEGTSK